MTPVVTVMVADARARAAHKADELAAALGAALGASGATVPVVVGTMADAPADGYVVVFGPAGLAEHAQVARRVVLLNADGAHVTEQLERYGLVAAVDVHRTFRWQTARDRERGAGLIGRRDLGAVIGATPSGSYKTLHYETLASEQHADLPALLAAYLRAHAGLPADPRETPVPAHAERGAERRVEARIVVGDAIDAGSTSGSYRAHIAGRPADRRIVTVTGPHDEPHAAMRGRLALPIDGIAALDRIASTDVLDGVGRPGDCLVEVEPAGASARSLGALAEPAAIRIAIDVAAILARAHAAGLVVEGIRPELIYVEGGRVTQLAPRGPAFVASSRFAEGVPAFAARYERETLTGKPVTAASDVFALCATLFELVTGFHPFGPTGAQLGRLASGRPLDWTGSPALGAVLARGLAAEPSARPTAAELGAALAPLAPRA